MYCINMNIKKTKKQKNSAQCLPQSPQEMPAILELLFLDAINETQLLKKTYFLRGRWHLLHKTFSTLTLYFCCFLHIRKSSPRCCSGVCSEIYLRQQWDKCVRNGSRGIVIYLESTCYCFCMTSKIGTGNCQGKQCTCSLRIEQGTRILPHFLQTSNIPPVFSHSFCGVEEFPYSIPGMDYNEESLKSVLALFKVLYTLVTYSVLPEGRQTLKAITVQHSPLPEARFRPSSVREASGSWFKVSKVRSPYPTGHALREGLAASLLELFNPRSARSPWPVEWPLLQIPLRPSCWILCQGSPTPTRLARFLEVKETKAGQTSIDKHTFYAGSVFLTSAHPPFFLPLFVCF